METDRDLIERRARREGEQARGKGEAGKRKESLFTTSKEHKSANKLDSDDTFEQVCG
jgi:hypothetical protein